MRIILLAETGELLDEGMRNTAYYLYRELSNHCEVKLMDMRFWRHSRFWIELKKFDPDIVHYLHGPTILSFIFLKLVRFYLPNTKIILSSPRPVLPTPIRPLLPFLKPDLILSHSLRSYRIFSTLGIRVRIFPLGVDINRFHPVSENKKKKLRKKYGLATKKFLILHIGSIKPGRNIHLLKDLNEENNQVLIVGRVSTRNDKKVYEMLRNNGVIIWLKYFQNIEELYQMANCYVYPVVYRSNRWGQNITDSIEIPLTVLEAMATNIKVITTKFGGLPLFFKEGEGLVYLDEPTPENLFKIVEKIKKERKVNTRKKILSFSWYRIAKMLLEVYSNVLKKG